MRSGVRRPSKTYTNNLCLRALRALTCSEEASEQEVKQTPAAPCLKKPFILRIVIFVEQIYVDTVDVGYG